MRALRDGDFRRLWSGQLVSALGDWLLVVAIPVHVYRVTGSATATGLVYAAENLPAVVVGPVAGVFVDRWDRRTTMAVVDALRAALLAAMVLAADPDLVWLLVAGVVIERVLAQLHDPAAAALVPNLVGTGDELASANAAFSASTAITRLVGGPAGGVLLATFGIVPLLLIDSATFAVSLVTVLTIRWRAAPRSSAPRRRRDVRGELGNGIRHLAHTPALRWTAGTMAAFLFCNGAVAGLLVPFVVERVGLGPSGVGLVLSALGGGYLLGAAVCTRVMAR